MNLKWKTKLTLRAQAMRNSSNQSADLKQKEEEVKVVLVQTHFS